ncbi:MAG: hypothetical protein U1E62_08215 [Alsobacter sp.]
MKSEEQWSEEYRLAVDVFRTFGVDPVGMTIEELRHARRVIARHSHPDLGGDMRAMTNVNVAYDTLTRRANSYAADEVVEDPSPPPAREPERPARTAAYSPPKTSRSDRASGPRGPAWAQAGGDVRFRPLQADIKRFDHSDRNYIRKHFWDSARPPRTAFHVRAFDGRSFTGLRLESSPLLKIKMAEAIAELHMAERKQPARAVIVSDLTADADGLSEFWLVEKEGLRKLTFVLATASLNEPSTINRINEILDGMARSS